MHDKIKVSVGVIAMEFGKCSGVTLALLGIIRSKRWRSACLILHANSSFLPFWNLPPLNDNKENVLNAADNDEEVYWLKNKLYNLKMADRKILLSDAWLNDRSMDAAQQLICKELGIEYQSVLNVQKTFGAVDDEHVQLLHDGSDHWFLSFCSSGRVQICDSQN